MHSRQPEEPLKTDEWEEKSFVRLRRWNTWLGSVTYKQFWTCQFATEVGPPLAYPLSYVLVLNAIPRQARRASWKLLLRWNPRSHDFVDATLCLCAPSSSLEVETWLLCIITALSLLVQRIYGVSTVSTWRHRFELVRLVGQNFWFDQENRWDLKWCTWLAITIFQLFRICIYILYREKFESFWTEFDTWEILEILEILKVLDRSLKISHIGRLV